MLPLQFSLIVHLLKNKVPRLSLPRMIRFLGYNRVHEKTSQTTIERSDQEGDH